MYTAVVVTGVLIELVLGESGNEWRVLIDWTFAVGPVKVHGRLVGSLIHGTLELGKEEEEGEASYFFIVDG
jgi:hypothetical protein